jgi:octaprenyl-diphosphate synthase
MSAAGFAAHLRGIDTELLQRLEQEVAFVEEELRAQICSQVELVAAVGRHTLEAGGKRLRPALVSLSAAATGLPYDMVRARKLGACMEMIHMATLIHDDVIDHAPTRRGLPTASSVYGNTASILSGDVLLSKAMRLLAVDGDIEIIRLVSEAVVQMAEGEVLELQTRGDFDLSFEAHVEILRQKTAIFIQVCCEVGALVAQADGGRQALRKYGHELGMAFQIADDLLDYRGDQTHTGKKQATDFREGCATLPLIHLRDRLSSDDLARARTWFGNGVADDEIKLLCEWMRDLGAFEASANDAEEHVQAAIRALDTLAPSPERDLLATVARFVSVRQS